MRLRLKPVSQGYGCWPVKVAAGVGVEYLRRRGEHVGRIRDEAEAGHCGGRNGADANVAGDNRLGDSRDPSLGEDDKVCGRAERYINLNRRLCDREDCQGDEHESSGEGVERYHAMSVMARRVS